MFWVPCPLSSHATFAITDLTHIFGAFRPRRPTALLLSWHSHARKLERWFKEQQCVPMTRRHSPHLRRCDAGWWDCSDTRLCCSVSLTCWDGGLPSHLRIMTVVWTMLVWSEKLDLLLNLPMTEIALPLLWGITNEQMSLHAGLNQSAWMCILTWVQGFEWGTSRGWSWVQHNILILDGDSGVH